MKQKGITMDSIIHLFFSIWGWTKEHLMYLNVIFAIALIFFERKNPKVVWAWLLAFYCLPVVGPLLYLILEQDLYKSHMFHVKYKVDINHLKMQEIWNHWKFPEEFAAVSEYNKEAGGFIYTDNNQVEIITDGKEKFKKLLEEIDKAQSYIHMEYYIIRDDEVFEEILHHLVQKVAVGVEVRILYDGMGSRRFPSKVKKKLQKQGIRVGIFFPARFGIVHVRLNYRNHRKIVVIDGKVGFTGGFNIGREYVSLDKRFGYWRDTHLIIKGNAVTALQIRFALDWNYAVKEDLFYNEKYFQDYQNDWNGHQGVQVITSGPDSQYQHIRNTYLQMIYSAKKQILIQTPYFIPDESVETALEIVIKSGVEVLLMLPCKPDHPFVYWTTYSYMGEMLRVGAHCFLYEQGFLHAKGIVVDGEVCCYGSANVDNRSFSLNFEVNAIIYDKEAAQKMKEVFEDDLKKCSEITIEEYEKRSYWIQMKEQVSRLIAPLL